VKNLMDTGVQLGRRFRALKLWMVLRHFGAEGLRTRLAEHMRLARLFAQWVDTSSEFERLAPVPFSVVCFRAIKAEHGGGAATDPETDALNERILEAVNSGGEIFISHTKLEGRYALRLATGDLHTTVRPRTSWPPGQTSRFSPPRHTACTPKAPDCSSTDGSFAPGMAPAVSARGVI
jgi:aromatic-L-amino-acid decarboxylase